MSDPVLQVRRQAAAALGELDGLERAPPGLLTALRDQDQELRVLAAQALGEIADPSAVPALAGALKDESAEVRRQAVQALGEIDHADVTQHLVLAMKDPDTEVRRLAAEALGERK
jgi:HEAT repeat protein